MEEQIKELLQLSEKGIEATIISYAHWYFVYSVSWLVFSGLLFIGAFIGYKLRNLWNDAKPLIFVIMAILIFIGLIIIPAHLPTVINPHAYATHQVITDIRSN